MRTKLTAQRALHSRTTRSSSAPWEWPCALRADEVNPDTRLLCPEIAGLKAHVCLPDETVVAAEVRAVSHHDVVLKVKDLRDIPIRGQVVEVTITQDRQIVLDAQKSILHWSGKVNKRSIVALFTVNSTETALEPWMQNDARGDVRFPVEVAATIQAGDGRKLNGRILDYSLGGCRLITPEPLVLDCEYKTAIQVLGSSIDIALRPRWAMKGQRGYQMGCTFRSEEGVLLACRHHAQNTPNDPPSNPMRTQLHNWNRREE